MSYVDFVDEGATALAIRVGGVEIVSTTRVADFVSLEIGGTEIVTSARALQNITTGDFSSDVTVGGTFEATGQGLFTAGFTIGADSAVLNKYNWTDFTPTFTIGGSSTGITYTTRVGRYVKIGKLVYVKIRVVFSSIGGLTGAVSITGLPFSVGDTSESIPLGYATGVSSLADAFLYLQGTTAFCFHRPSGGNAADVTHSNLSDTTNLTFNGCYEASS